MKIVFLKFKRFPKFPPTPPGRIPKVGAEGGDANVRGEEVGWGWALRWWGVGEVGVGVSR